VVDGKPGSLAVYLEAVNGGIETVTGNPKSGATPATRQTQNHINYVGDINFAIQPSAAATGAKFRVLSTGADSVMLGATGTCTPPVGAGTGESGHSINAIAPNHVMMYEQFEQFMGTVLEWMDKHVHLSAMGPTGPGAGGPQGPVTPQAKMQMPPIKSTRVVVGG
jgi:hypothetical protein